jgi:hypothetical protein
MSSASRVVSLLPSATEILFAIGAGDRVVGVTHECDHPDAARGLPKVTASLLPTEGVAPGDIDRHIHAARHAGSSIYRLDEAELARVEPDLIITQELCDVCAVAYSEVRRAVRRLAGDVPVLSLEPRSMEEICLSIEEGRRRHRVCRRRRSYRRSDATAHCRDRRAPAPRTAAARRVHRVDGPAHGRRPLGARDRPDRRWGRCPRC